MDCSGMQQYQWSQRIDGQVVSLDRFRLLKQALRWHVVGFFGWCAPRPDEPIPWSEEPIRTRLQLLDKKHGKRLMVLATGTMTGFLGLAYKCCKYEGIAHASIVPSEALKQGTQRSVSWLIPCGSAFGDETLSMVSLCDEVIAFGGGKYTLREVQTAIKHKVKVDLIRGFGGVSDMRYEDIINAEPDSCE